MGQHQDTVGASELVRRIGAQVQVSAQQAGNQLFRGRLSWQRLRSGLSLHCSDCVELEDFSTSVEVDPKLILVLFLQGRSDVSYDDRAPHFDHDARRPEGMAVTLTEPATFSRRARRGQHIRKLSISMTPDWFEGGGFDAQRSLKALLGGANSHLRVQRWLPSPRALALAEASMHQQADNPLLAHLQQESRALELAHEVIAGLTGEGVAVPDSLRPHEQRLIARVQDLLISDTADGWSLEQIAHEVGTSASTLQRQFKAAQGMSLFAWQRQRKLQQAFDALAAGTLSIEEAAALAGYGSAANFATAFRRAFGSTPQQVRRFL